VPGPYLRGILTLSLALGALVAAPGVLAQADSPRVLAVHLDNDINPVTQEYVENSVDPIKERAEPVQSNVQARLHEHEAILTVRQAVD